MIVVGASLGADVQRRRPARRTRRDARPHPAPGAGAARCRSRTRCGAASAPGVTLAMFTLVVFTLVVGRRRPGFVPERLQQHRGVRRRLRRPGDAPRRRRRSRTCAPRSRHAGHRTRPTSASSRASPRCRSRRARSASAATEESYVVNGADAAFLAHTTYKLAAIARGYGSSADGLARAPHAARTSRSSTSSSSRAGRTGTSRRRRISSWRASTSRTSVFDPVKMTVRDPQTGKQLTPDRHRRPVRHRTRVHGRHLDVAGHARAVFGNRVLPTIHSFALAAGGRPGGDRADSSSRPSSRTACRRTRWRSCSTTPSRRT